MNVPRLRFKEFNGKWNIKKLEDISSQISYGLTVRPEYISKGIPLISAREIKDGFIDYDKAPKISHASFEMLSKKAVAKKGDIFLSKTGTIGLVAYVNSDLTIAITQNIAVIRVTKEDYSHQYILQFLRTEKFYESAIAKVNQSTIMDLQLQDIRKLSICFPSIHEQTKIANFLTAIDEKISQLTQKYDLLVQYKKGVMQQIFSQKLRFKDENGRKFPEWEERLLCEISSFFSGGIPLTTRKDFYIGEIPFIKSGEISSTKTAQFISETGLKESSAKMVSTGDLLYALYGATSGEVAVSQIKGAINQAVLCIRSKLNTYFLFSYFLFRKENIRQTYLQGGQGNLSAEIIKSLIVPIPSELEQTKIANFLTAIDDKITHTKTQLDAVKLYKKGLLQQLFI